MAKWRDYVEPEDIVPLHEVPEPEDDAPRAIGVLFGAQPGWSPARESQALGHCNICGNGQRGTPIQPGSRVVCGGCGRYGYDKLIEVMLDENPAPEPDAQPKPPVQVKARFKPRG